MARTLTSSIITAVIALGVAGFSMYSFGEKNGEEKARQDITQTLIMDKTDLAHDARIIGRTAAEQDSLLDEANQINNVLQRLYKEGQLEGITQDQYRHIFPLQKKDYDALKGIGI